MSPECETLAEGPQTNLVIAPVGGTGTADKEQCIVIPCWHGRTAQVL